ncbi:hypothetical protein EDB86DRAFT_3242507 [Lactarius hatsudake]|nr:hypothetical protein EDB86DRAFT_3242507 [Lactarius hatsudake]
MGQLRLGRYSLFCTLTATANPLHATIAAKGLSPMRLPYAAANAGPAATSGFSDGQPKPKVRHLNMQKAAQGSASYLLAFIGIGGPRWLSLCPIPIPDGGVRCIQITASPASHDFTPLPAVKPFPPIPGGPQSGGNRVTILPMRTQCNSVTRCEIGVLVRVFRVLTGLLARVLLSGPVPIGASSLLWDKTAGCWLRFIGCGSTLRFCGYPPATHWRARRNTPRSWGLPWSSASASTESFTSAQKYEVASNLDEVILHEGLSAGTHPFTFSRIGVFAAFLAFAFIRLQNASTSMMRLLYTALSQRNHVIPTGIAFRLKQFTTWFHLLRQIAQREKAAHSPGQEVTIAFTPRKRNPYEPKDHHHFGPLLAGHYSQPFGQKSEVGKFCRSRPAAEGRGFCIG